MRTAPLHLPVWLADVAKANAHSTPLTVMIKTHAPSTIVDPM
jgi:hypothetical protein